MALTLREIRKPIASELETFEKRFRASMKSQTPLLDKIMYYIVKRKGKQMRPMFVLFSAILGGGITEATHRGASLIELLHTATLVHDDVVDDADKRRGLFSINALWKNKIAVLVGDYLLSKGLLLSLEHKDYQLLHLVSEAVKDMSEGELLQMEKARQLNIDETVYYEIIRQKTASLIRAACGIGFASASEDEEQLSRILTFGEKIGIAFQIRDDLFDYGTDDIGKPTGNDIKERKLTLPLIYALSKASMTDKRHITYNLKNHYEDKKKVRQILDYVQKSGGIEYAQDAMQSYKSEALAILDSFPSNAGSEGIRNLILYTTERKK